MRALGKLAELISVHPLTRDAPLAAWGRFAAWQIRSRLQGEVIVPWVGGQKLAVRRGMTGATGNIYLGLHEFADMMLALHFLRPDDLFLDIGANVGSYTVLASGIAGARTIAFEPDPGTAGHLRRNIALNGLGARVEVAGCALGATEGEVWFTAGLDTMNKVTTAGAEGARRVPVRALDDVLAGRSPAMMKIDVEGYEDEMLKGAGRSLRDPALKVIEIETVSPAAEATLRDLGFERLHYDPLSRRLGGEASMAGSANAAFIRDREMVEERLRSAPKIRVLGRDI